MSKPDKTPPQAPTDPAAPPAPSAPLFAVHVRTKHDAVSVEESKRSTKHGPYYAAGYAFLSRPQSIEVDAATLELLKGDPHLIVESAKAGVTLPKAEKLPEALDQIEDLRQRLETALATIATLRGEIARLKGDEEDEPARRPSARYGRLPVSMSPGG